MKATVDATKCEAYGTCAELCPSVFQLDEWGYASLVGDGEVPTGDEARATEAAASCPEHAITLVD
ncbi:ferredoxin [Nocardioides sp. AN3]